MCGMEHHCMQMRSSCCHCPQVWISVTISQACKDVSTCSGRCHCMWTAIAVHAQWCLCGCRAGRGSWSSCCLSYKHQDEYHPLPPMSCFIDYRHSLPILKLVSGRRYCGSACCLFWCKQCFSVEDGRDLVTADMSFKHSEADLWISGFGGSNDFRC